MYSNCQYKNPFAEKDDFQSSFSFKNKSFTRKLKKIKKEAERHHYQIIYPDFTLDDDQYENQM